MSTPEFEVHRAIVHSSNVSTGAAEVRIPSLLGAGQVVSVPTTGLTQIGGLWNVPSVGTSTFVAVSADRTQFLWVTAVTVPSSGDDQEVVDSLQFNIDAGLEANQEGLLVWNEDWGTVDIGLHGSNAVLHVGQQVYYYAKNQTGSQIDKGTVVRFDGALGASGHLKMAPFLADGSYPSEYIMGITAHDIPAGDDGYVVHFGAIRGIDTDTPNWNEGDVLYASPTVAGGMTTTVPTAPNNIVLLAAVINRHQQNGELFVRPTIAANILKDEGIIYTALSDNQLLSYDSAQGVFVNETFSPTITLTGDATGSVTLTDLGSGTLTVTVADDSHNHTIANVDNLQTTLDGKYSTSGGTVSGNVTVTGRLDVNGRIYPDDWIQFDQYEGLYSPLNAAHFYVNNGSYGSWRVSGTRNGWHGIEFDGAGSANNQNWTFMMTASNNFSGVHNNSVGWMWYFNYQDLYCNSYRGFNNVAGTGNASYHPSGIYSTGTNWLYGQIITNNNAINAGSGVITCGEINQNGGTANDFYGESKFRYASTSNDWSAQPVQEISAYDIGYATRSLDSDTHTGQLRAASGIWYARNHNDGAYWTVAAVISNQSSRRMKQDIETWGSMKPLSSAVNADYDTTATDLIKQLRPVYYRFNKQDRLPRDIPSERRQEALDRLNRIRMSKGLNQYDGEEAIHECGRDCDYTPEDPCPLYKQWERGTLGFIAEEVGEVIPEVADMDVRPNSNFQGDNTAIDNLALTAVLTKAFQELESRLTALESSSV